MATNWGLGRKSQCLVAWEDAYKTNYSPIAIAYKLPYNSVDVSLNQPLNQVGTIRNNINPQLPFRGNKDVNGSVTVPLDNKGLGFWLAALLGACADGGSGPTGYTHTFKLSGDPRSFVLDKGYTDIPAYYMYSGCRLTTMGLTLGGDGEATADFGIMGSGEDSSSLEMAGATITDTTNWSTVSDRFEQFEASVNEGGSPISYLTQVTMSIDKNVEGAYCIGGAGTRSQIADGIASVTGTITGLFKDDTLLAKGRDFTETSLVLTLTSGTNILAITIPEIVLEQNTPPIEGPGGFLLNLNYSAYFADATEATSFQVVLTNSIADYDIPAQS